MKFERTAMKNIGAFAACLAMGLAPGMAQKPAAPAKSAPSAAAERTRQILTANARALESRGRPDMAIQIWQQLLLSEPRNTEALAGLARDYKLSGSLKESDAALEKLRAINPNDPNIARIEAMATTRAQSDRLRQAGLLARQGKNEDAMRIYRELYGDRPPEGDVALAYYQTLYGTSGGKEQAIGAMRALAQRSPGDPRYAVELGRMLTYDAHTRAEGIRMLQQYPQDPNAREALRQALIWNAANPASATEMRQYLKEHPQDTEIAKHLEQNEQTLARMNSGIARTPEERAAFAALNAHRLHDAEARFTALLQKNSSNGRAAAGMGFLRMQQNNFAGAISYLNRAEQSGYKASTVEDALATSRFWFTMGEGTQALNANQFDAAAAKYREALVMRPRSVDALNGLAGLYVKQQQYAEAGSVYDQILKIQLRNNEAWRGLFLAYARGGQTDKALSMVDQFPPTVKTAMAKDPEYLRTLAAIYNSRGRTVEAQKVLSQALALPFPNRGKDLKIDTQLQYAGILMEADRFGQAAALYTDILNEDGTSVPGWMGLVSAHHEMNQDSQALADVEKMPPAAYESALSDGGFLELLGSIYQRANQPEIAQGLLERAAKLQSAPGKQPSIPLQLQLAAIYLQRGDSAQAYSIYRQVLTAHPDSLDAWKGLMATLQGTNHTNEALQELAYIPAAVLTKLEADPQFVQTEASIYASAGDTARASEYLNRVLRYYAQLGRPEPADVAIQNAWVLYNTKNDRALYPALMRLGGRQDLTAAQRETVQTIWANWAVQRAAVASENNENDRAVEILEAAAAAFPENLEVRRVLAGGYLKTGQARESLAIYRSLTMQNASAADYQGGIGAALAANDRMQAEAWLREGLERYPADYRILGLAARFEQARGDNQRAADFWRAAIAAMPAGTPTDRLAHDLAYPDVNTKAHKARTAADLQVLLDPEYAAANDPFPKTVKLPPLPSYGPDPYLGRAAVVPATQQSASNPQPDFPGVPATTQIPVTQNQGQDNASGQGLSVPSGTPGSSKSKSGKPNAQHRSKSATAGQGSYSGHMNLPASEENITTTETERPAPQTQRPQPVWIPSPSTESTTPPPVNGPAQPAEPLPQQQTQPPPIFIPSPQSSLQLPDSNNKTGLRISSQPMDPAAAQAQVRFAEQTDGQLTQGSAAQIRALGNAPINVPSSQVPSSAVPSSPVPSSAAAQQSAAEPPARMPDYNGVQYTPSAQEAATGAYSAQKQPQAQVATEQRNKPTPVQKPSASTQPAVKKKPSKQPTQTVPTLATAPTEQNPPVPNLQQQASESPQQQEVAPATPAGISDEELEQRNLPPLRGPWVRVKREPRIISPREEAEQQLHAIESGYSGWIGGTGLVNYRSGDLGYDRLAALESPFEYSAPLGYNGRLTVVTKPVFLDSGQADGNSVIQVEEASTAGRTLVTIPQPLGTATSTGPSGTGTAAISGNLPPQQNASGIAGEVQLAFPHLALAGGYTPYGFLVANWTGRAQWRPANGPFTFNFVRDSVKDTQLSYAGLRDPGTASLSYPGAIWGGVMANQGNVQYARGDAMSGFYFGFGGQYLTGYEVQSNTRFDGTGGAYWRVKAFPEYGTLSVGVNFFGMHYAHDEGAYTFGMGGYFSPQAYFLGNAPVTWVGHYQTRWHYEVLGGLGVQAFQRDLTPLFPLAAQKANEVELNNAALPAMTSVGANYNLRTDISYQIGPHWFAGGFVTANNSRNYNAASAGFSIHYMFRSQPSTVTSPTGLFPTEGLRPFTVP